MFLVNVSTPAVRHHFPNKYNCSLLSELYLILDRIIYKLKRKKKKVFIDPYYTILLNGRFSLPLGLPAYKRSST